MEKSITGYTLEWNPAVLKGFVYFNLDTDPTPEVEPLEVASIAELAAWATLLSSGGWVIENKRLRRISTV